MTFDPIASIPATLIPGDGIGPEIVEAVIEILDALGSPFAWDHQQGGMAALETHGDTLPRATLDSIRHTRLALKGPLTTPVGGGFRSVNVRLRQELQLYANVRPARTLVQNTRFKDVDIVIVRENLEGLYVAHEYFIPVGNDPHAVAVSSGVNTREGARRIVTYAFEYALRNGRKKLRWFTKPTCSSSCQVYSSKKRGRSPGATRAVLRWTIALWTLVQCNSRSTLGNLT